MAKSTFADKAWFQKRVALHKKQDRAKALLQLDRDRYLTDEERAELRSLVAEGVLA